VTPTRTRSLPIAILSTVLDKDIIVFLK
jgi:hypothetical protein